MQDNSESLKFGFFCEATETFYYFETQEEFNMMMQIMQESQLTDSLELDASPQDQHFNDFDHIISEINRNAAPSMDIELQEIDF